MSEFIDNSGFPTTCWSRIVLSPSREAADRSAALEALARAYWRPVCAYVRARWGRSPEDARDLTQEFFLWMIESDFLSKVDRDRGRFRAVLKVSLSHFLADAQRWVLAQKRGGGAKTLSLDLPQGDLPAIEVPDPRGRAPEEVLDDEWRRELLARATELLEESLRREGKGTTFEVFRDYYLSDDGNLDYAAVARRYEISASDVSNHLQRAKARYRETLRRLVEETVQGGEEMREEMAWLLGEGRR